MWHRCGRCGTGVGGVAQVWEVWHRCGRCGTGVGGVAQCGRCGTGFNANHLSPIASNLKGTSSIITVLP